MGVLLHFALLVSFMWMGVEGVRLCRMVLYVFNLRDWTRFYLTTAYLVPTIVVTVTVLTAYYTTGVLEAYAGDETYNSDIVNTCVSFDQCHVEFVQMLVERRQL